jgi:hypothetical protein
MQFPSGKKKKKKKKGKRWVNMQSDIQSEACTLSVRMLKGIFFILRGEEP